MSFDLIVFVVILLFAVMAYFRGIVKEVFALLALYLAGMASYFCGHWLISPFKGMMGVAKDGAFPKDAYIFGFISPAITAKVLAYIAMYFIVFVIIGFIGYFINQKLKDSKAGTTYRFVSAGFGALKGFLIIFVLYLPLAVVLGQDRFPEFIRTSTSAKVFNKVLSWSNDSFALEEKVKEKNEALKADLEKRIRDELGDSLEKSRAEYMRKLENGVNPEKAAKDMTAEILQKLNSSDNGADKFSISQEQMDEIAKKIISVNSEKPK